MSACKWFNIRFIRTQFVCQKRTFSSFKANGTKWTDAVAKAENVVGYPTSFLNLRWIVSDEIANVAEHLNRLVGSKHPLLPTAKEILLSGKHNIPAWGLIVLLFSNVSGIAKVGDDVPQRQRMVSEATELLRTWHVVHSNGIMNVEAVTDKQLGKDLHHGNKLAILFGDFLLARIGLLIAGLRNQDVFGLMSSIVRDISEGEFYGRRNANNHPLPTQSGFAKEEWMFRNRLQIGNLVGKSCKSVLMLAGHTEFMQEVGFCFGENLALAYQAHSDLSRFESDSVERISLISAPVLFYLQAHPNMSKEIEEMDDRTLRKLVSSEPKVLEQTELIKNEHLSLALDYLCCFEFSEGRETLKNLVTAMVS